MDAVLAKKWNDIYAYSSDDELKTTAWDSATFSKFCEKLSQYGWPSNDTYTMEEAMPPVNAPSGNGIGTDVSWDPSARHRYVVTFRTKPDKASDFIVMLDYRHNRTGSWNPDVLSMVFAISRAMPQGKPSLGLLEALNAVGKDEVTVYPLGQQTTVAALKEHQAGKKNNWLWMKHQGFH